ncbi:MAG: hypothetical protein A2521_01805 [Deltaproteobacteria bacterium RIFOXYD12_FULL_57_12]|nr:MAG: hypothetical protein A2521_01805 [Deltaproteobacteria bacterium RIFOXYD12_FULL_57_12]
MFQSDSHHYKISISVKLSIILVLGMVMIFGVIGVLNLRLQRSHLMDGVYQNADQVSDIIKRGTRLSMLKNERGRIYQTVKDFAQEPGILKIRIYNKEGRISFSTEPNEMGKEVDVHAEACVVCHAGPLPSANAPIFERARDYRNEEGRHVLGVISPIKSDESCVSAACHAHSADKQVLGVLDVIMQLDKVDTSQHENETRYLYFMGLAITAICLLLIIFIYLMVYRPVNEIVEGTKRVAGGDLDFKINIKSRDEIGGLASSFNSMAEGLKKSQHQLLSAKAYTDNIIRSMSNSLVVVDQDALIRKVNKATCELLEYSPNELIGKPLRMIFAGGYFDDVGLSELPIKHFDISVETTYLSKSGKKIPVLFSGSIVRDDQDKIQGVVCMAQDVSWQTEAMHAGHLTALGELAAGVAHEINNPINSIINFAQIMIDELQRGATLTEEIPTTIIKEGDRVSGIVSSLLSFARERERVKTPVSIYEVLQETLALTETQLIKDGIKLEAVVPHTLPEINGEFQQLQQVFINIINNARFALNEKYPAANPDKILAIFAMPGSLEGRPAVEIIFHDHGTGIPTHIINKVMNPFFSTKPAGIGTGLGLAISHGIITDHNGKIAIESNEGSFTRIIISLPTTPEREAV